MEAIVSKTEQQVYEERLKAHNEYYERCKPVREDFTSDKEYGYAMSAWQMNKICDAPNRPGYERANND